MQIDEQLSRLLSLLLLLIVTCVTVVDGEWAECKIVISFAIGIFHWPQVALMKATTIA